MGRMGASFCGSPPWGAGVSRFSISPSSLLGGSMDLSCGSWESYVSLSLCVCLCVCFVAAAVVVTSSVDWCMDGVAVPVSVA